MAQLTDDCFAFSGPLMPIDEVERIIRERVMPVAETETVPLAAAYGRVMASDVTAPISLPPFDNSAVDGYAVRSADLDPAAETRLAITGRVTAGHAAAQALAPGAAMRIFTGAPMPAGADTVFMQEDVRLEAQAVLVPPGLAAGANRRLAGEDVRAGAVVLPAGRRLAAQHVALAAAVGLTQLPVRRRIRVAVLSTGDEIVEPGAPRPSAALFDANRYLLAGLLAGLGAQSSDLGIVPDDPQALTRAISAAAEAHDLVLTSGGVSTGEADHVRSAVAIDRLPGVLARRRQTRPAGRHGGDPGIAARHRRRVRRAAGQSGRGVRDLRARGAAAAWRGFPAPRWRRWLRCRCGPPSGTARRRGGANISGWRCGARPTA